MIAGDDAVTHMNQATGIFAPEDATALAGNIVNDGHMRQKNSAKCRDRAAELTAMIAT